MPPKIEVKVSRNNLLCKQPNITCEEITSKCVCPKCLKEFTTKGNLTRHLKKSCIGVIRVRDEQLQIMSEQIQSLVEAIKERDKMDVIRFDKIDQIEKDLEAIKDNPTIINPTSNNLNVMCLGSQDNLLDMLTLESGRPFALTLIKNCALSRSGGDCHILEKVYFPKDKRPALMYANKSKTHYVYYNENNIRIVENNAEVMAKKLADILQRTYSKGIKYFKKDLYGNITENPVGETIEIEASDRDNWNAHIHALNEPKYQKSVLKSMHIPFEKDIKIKYP